MAHSMNCSPNSTKPEEQSTFEVDSDNDTYPDYVSDYAAENHCYDSQRCDPSHFDYKYYIDGILLFIVAICGITGTLMSVAVLFKPQLQNPFTKLLTFLCIFDGTFLTMAIFYISLPSLSCW